MITKFQSDLPCCNQRLFALGRHHADAIAQIQSRGLEAALEAVDCMGGVRQRMGIARSLVKLLSKAGTVPAYLIETRQRQRMEDRQHVQEITVYTPHLAWKFRNRKQIAVLEWFPIWSVTDRQGAPVLVLPLP